MRPADRTGQRAGSSPNPPTTLASVPVIFAAISCTFAVTPVDRAEQLWQDHLPQHVRALTTPSGERCWPGSIAPLDQPDNDRAETISGPAGRA